MFVTDLKNSDEKLSMLCIQRIINYNENRATVNFIKVTPEANEKLLLTQTEYRILGIKHIKSATEKLLLVYMK